MLPANRSARTPTLPMAVFPTRARSSSSVTADAGVDTGTVTSSDGFGASRTACINKINALRATDTAVALQPYTLENDDAIDTCVDTQASNDQSMNSAHYSFINNAPACMWGSAMGWAQNECVQGYGTTARASSSACRTCGTRA